MAGLRRGSKSFKVALYEYGFFPRRMDASRIKGRYRLGIFSHYNRPKDEQRDC
jgi:hypothetical protein